MKKPPTQLAEYFLAGEHERAMDLIKEFKSNSNAEVFQTLITPAMQHIGDLWEQNLITVADEHLATAVCDFVLSRLYSWQSTEKDNKKNKVMLLCLEGEQHYIGLKMVSTLFVEKGWNVKFFGSNLPIEYTIKTALQWQPDVVCLSVTIVYHLPKLKEYIEKLSSLPHRPVIVIGGRIAGKYDLSSYCTEETVILEDLSTVDYWINKWEAKEKLNASI